MVHLVFFNSSTALERERDRLEQDQQAHRRWSQRVRGTEEFENEHVQRSGESRFEHMLFSKSGIGDQLTLCLSRMGSTEIEHRMYIQLSSRRRSRSSSSLKNNNAAEEESEASSRGSSVRPHRTIQQPRQIQ